MASEASKNLVGLKKALFRACEEKDGQLDSSYWAHLRRELKQIKKVKEKERRLRVVLGK